MNIYIRNLSPETLCSELLGCFEEFGEVKDVTISTYTVEGRPRASGFVEMLSRKQGLAAIVSLQGKELSGSLLQIQGG
ncbi:MAG: RNA-binding protein [candidate division Zixibacteria bacterium]|nr:RNA-binding protein [candidate division Zixibacteria bacterium]